MRAIRNDDAKEMRGLGKGTRKSADDLATTLLLAVHVARMFR